jgi:ring-1,2-phenylacetyl-CoA epoxidase subunit PaaD
MVTSAPMVPVTTDASRLRAVWRVLEGVADPEIPVVSIVELGIVRDVALRDGKVVVTVTPTYSGCPATEVIAADIESAVTAAGERDCRIEMVLSPPWTTDWLAPAARERLALYGIAPPGPRTTETSSVIDLSGLRRRPVAAVACPRCGSSHTREQSRYGSTPCKAQYRCEDCLEPFDYFKPH